MSNVSPTTANGYYSLNNQSSGTSGTAGSSATGSGTTAPASTPAPAKLPSLAYILNLSDEAQSYLNGTSSGVNSLFGNSGSTPASTQYTLTNAQQKTLTAILTKYKDAPYTQATFNQIQDDLTRAGLSTVTLGAQDVANSFNPTRFLLNALSGITQPTTTAPTAAEMATKSSNFMNSVISQWKSISTTAADATDTAPDTTPTASS